VNILFVNIMFVRV